MVNVIYVPAGRGVWLDVANELQLGFKYEVRHL